MKKAIVTTIVSLIAALLVTQDHISASVVSFLVAGAIPGTSMSVPFWAMLSFYCLAITIIVTVFVETTFIAHRANYHETTPARRLPKRRYTTL